MKKIEIMGRKFNLRNEDEVSYGAQKEVSKVKEKAKLAMMSNKDISDLYLGKEGAAMDGEQAITEETLLERIAKGDIKSALMDSYDAAVTPEEEVIMLSANVTREDILEMPGKMVKELAKAAGDELGGLENFIKTSTIDST